MYQASPSGCRRVSKTNETKENTIRDRKNTSYGVAPVQLRSPLLTEVDNFFTTLRYVFERKFTCHNSVRPDLPNQQDTMGAYTPASWLWINCECGGIVRNDIFPDTLPNKYPYFSPFV